MKKSSPVWHPNTQMQEWSNLIKLLEARKCGLIDSREINCWMGLQVCGVMYGVTQKKN